MKYCIDSSAWIEYLEGSSAGERVARILKENHEFFILSLNIGEVVSKVQRKKADAEVAYRAMITRAKIVDATPQIAKDAGLLHARKRQEGSSFSLADAFIITAAKALSAKVLTTDPHFKSFKEAEML